MTSASRGRAAGGFDTIVLEPLDIDALSIEDEARETQGMAPRYAVPTPVTIVPMKEDTWEKTDGNRIVWRRRIQATGALSINLGFTRYVMPEGGHLSIYATDGSAEIRPFTAEDNEAHGELWTPPIISDDIIVEISLPARTEDRLELELSFINQGYRGFGQSSGLRSGSCNVDVICPEGDDWRGPIASVGVISTGGSTFCTGFMVNNTSEDLTPYFMTADHCGISAGAAPSLVVFWNYDNSWCRPVGSPASGGPGDGSLSQFQTGSVFRAEYGPSDMTLVVLDDDPDPAWNVGYAGWDRSTGDSSSAVAIHHPNTDEKRISFENAATTTTSYLGSSTPGDGTHVRVIDWDLGTTEPGSSGSPLFNQDQRVVGQLHGGYAACGNDDSDWYGRFSLSWTGGGTSSSRLSDWLDSGNTGATTTDFISLATLCTDAGQVSFGRANHACEDTATVKVVDCGLDLDPAAVETISITVKSDSESAGESVLLTETRIDSAKFEGTIALSATDSAGVLLVGEGDTLTATYVDADDGAGGTNIVVTDTADVDCTPPVITNVQISGIGPRSADVKFNTNELAVGAVHYGLSCASLVGTAESSNYDTVVQIALSGLQDATDYFLSVEAQDGAGNTATDDNGGVCYSFTTPEVPDYFTEEFGSDNDLNQLMILFAPDGSGDFYSACAEAIGSLPTDPSGGTTLSLTDDSSSRIDLNTDTVSLYGTGYSSFYVGSNGFITFNSGDSDYDETLGEHFAPLPRISALYDDFNPAAGGAVSWKELADRAVVTWQNVPEYGTGNSNTFQVEMYFDGRIRLAYMAIAATDGIVGLSDGSGTPPAFLENDLSAAGACEAQRPGQPAYPHNERKNRYISFAPNNGGNSVAFRVELLNSDYFPGSAGVLGWVSEPNAEGIARIVNSRVDRVWLEQTVHAGDCEVVPVATYQIRAISTGSSEDNPDNFSGGLRVETIRKPGEHYWADAVGSLLSVCSGDRVTPCEDASDCPPGDVCGVYPGPDGIVNFNDIGAGVKAFQQVQGMALPHITWVDVHGNDGGDMFRDPPNGVANFSDVQQMVLAFQGQPYSFSDPSDCP